MKRVFVTGGSGFIGKHLISKLTGMNNVITNYDTEQGSNINVNNVVGDILDFDKVMYHLKGHDTVCHLAAMVGVVKCQANEGLMYQINYEGLENIVKACHDSNVKKFVFASSSEVYGEGGVGCIFDEYAQLAPKSMYGKAKRDAELYIMSSFKNASILRYSNIYGPQQRYDFVVPAFIITAIMGHPLTICGDGEQVRCFTYISDAVEGTVKALEHDEDSYEVYNITSGKPTSNISLSKIICNLCNNTCEPYFLKYEELRRDPSVEIKHRILLPAKAEERLNFSSKTSLYNGLQHTIAHYKKELAV